MEEGMRCVCNGRFTDGLGFTFERYNCVDKERRPMPPLFLMRADGSRDVFEAVSPERYGTAYREYKERHGWRLSAAGMYIRAVKRLYGAEAAVAAAEEGGGEGAAAIARDNRKCVKGMLWGVQSVLASVFGFTKDELESLESEALGQGDGKGGKL